MTTLYLHIGTHRTATSSIQDFVLANWDAFLSRGILHPMRKARHNHLFDAIFAGNLSVEDVSVDLAKRASRHPHKVHTIILSDEDVCMRRDLSVLGGFSRYFDVKVIYALRRQDLWLESWYLQNIKWQWDKNLSHLKLEEFMAKAEDFHWVYYDRLLNHLEGIFGKDKVLPYVFEKSQMPNGPVAAFCERIGLADLSGLSPARHVNSSYSPTIAEFVRCLPFDEAPEDYRAHLEAAAFAVDETLSQTGRTRSSLILDFDTRMKVLATHDMGNANVARRYFGRDNLFLETMPSPDAPLASLTLPESSEELMSNYVAPMIRALIQQHMASRSLGFPAPLPLRQLRKQTEAGDRT